MANYPEQRATETTKAYDAFVSYCALGAGRTCEQVAEKYQKSVSLIYRWCREHSWLERIKEWDQALADEAAQAHSARYIANLEAHREKAMTSAKNLLALANGLTRIMGDALSQPRMIEGKDGKTYTLHKVVADPSTLTTISKALQTALDIEAHALGIDQMEETQD